MVSDILYNTLESAVINGLNLCKIIINIPIIIYKPIKLLNILKLIVIIFILYFIFYILKNNLSIYCIRSIY